MFEIPLITTDLAKDILFFTLIILTIIRMGGISFLLRLFLKILRVDFSDDRLKKHNNDIFNVQIYRFLTGAHLKNIDDVILVTKGIEKGKFNRFSFFFSGFFGPLGDKRKVNFEIVLMFLFIAALFILSITMICNKPYHKNGYATYNYRGDEIMISSSRIYDTKKKEYLRKEYCEAIKTSKESIYTGACDYLVTTTPEKRNELINAIRDERVAAYIYTFVSMSFFLISVLLGVGFYNFICLNRILCDIKDGKEMID
ncbi:hypothetical protein [Yersinia sp. 2541 StPb PI]|uniref:hypothetical protein n=1 Tax=Yersinia sp. 2541 StPb PI TaxID=3117407 RepID=UPI003FA4A003